MVINDILKEDKNIAEKLDEKTLKDIGEEVIESFDLDNASREGWKKAVKEYVKLALQVCDEKTFPWPNAANVKFPLIATAALQFNARAYPTLVPPNGKIVSVASYGQDPQNKKLARAKRVEQYMSYQLMYEMTGWEDHMDNLLSILPIFGLAIKKTYFDPAKKTNQSVLVHPFNFVVNYWTSDLDSCSRCSEIIYRTKREILSNQRKKLYLDVDLGTPYLEENTKEEMNASRNQRPMDEEDPESEFSPYMLIEQHTYLDLDEDGFSEPYVVLVEYNSRQVLRITPRYTEQDIEFNEDGKVSEIKGTSYYTKFSFIPSADGSFYTRGFGHLLGPINESMNTIINQLIDAGTLSNLQSGYIGKGLKLRQGQELFRPGEWKQVNSLGRDLKENIFPLPVREPSNVLFQLLGLLNTSGKELASVAEIFVGKMPGQNTPAYTTQQTVEQGMKLFTAIYKRVYRSLEEEFKKLYNLNAIYLDEQDYKDVLDDPQATKEDFNYSDKDICPSADPSASSEADKLQKYNAVGSLIQLGTINPLSYTVQTLMGMGFQDSEIQNLIKGSKATQPPQPSPEQQQIQMEMQQSQQETQQKLQIEQTKTALKERESEFKMIMQQQQQAFDQKMTAVQAATQQQFDSLREQLGLAAEAAKHTQSLQQAQELHTQKMEQQKEVAQSKPKKG